MIDQAIRQGDEGVAPGLHMSQLDSGRVGALNNAGEETSSHRRITAESFRLLSARLRKSPIPNIVVQAAVEPAYVPSAVIEVVAPPTPAIVEEAVEVIEVVVEKPSFPTFDDQPIAVEALAPAVEEEVPTEFETVEEHFEPLSPVESKPVQAVAEEVNFPIFEEEPVIAVAPAPTIEEVVPQVELVAEHFEPPVAEIERQEIVEEMLVAEPAIEEIANVEALPQAEVQGIGEIAKSIYVTPSSSDRTAFLAECAAMAAAEVQAEQARAEVPAIIYSEPSALKPNIRRVDPADDPFAKITLDDHVEGIKVIATDEDAGELARSLLDMMLSSPSAGLPQERALAADALLKLIPRIPLRSLVAIVERVSIMENPPNLLVIKLINDSRIEVAGPLLELCNHISDQVLSKVIATGQVSLQRLIARRRHISAVLSDQLIQFDDTSVILTLVRNNGVTISHTSFSLLADHARRHHSVLAPLSTRSDLPAPIAFELFWFVPAELRRYLLSRFLTDSETLTKILKITQTMQGDEHAGEAKFPERESIETFVELLIDGKLPESSEKLAEIGGIQLETALRIVSDRDGEPLAIMFKAMGTNRGRFGEIAELLKKSDFGIIRGDRDTEELQSVFDSMSFNKARVLLTYWDWAALKSGPYAPAN